MLFLLQRMLHRWPRAEAAGPVPGQPQAAPAQGGGRVGRRAAPHLSLVPPLSASVIPLRPRPAAQARLSRAPREARVRRTEVFATESSRVVSRAPIRLVDDEDQMPPKLG